MGVSLVFPWSDQMIPAFWGSNKKPAQLALKSKETAELRIICRHWGVQDRSYLVRDRANPILLDNFS